MKFANKIASAGLTIVLSLSALFFLIRLTPGDPIERILGPEATQAQMDLLREQLGLNLSLFEQFAQFLKGVFVGDLGNSLYRSESVMTLLLNHVGPTLIIAMSSVGLAFIWGGVVGLKAAINRGRWMDNLLRLVSLLFLSFPIFSLAPLLVLVFSVYLDLLPVSEWGGLPHMILPIVSIALPLGAVLSRVTRNRYLEEMDAPWVVVLRAKGLSERAIELRVVKACLPTLLNVVAIQLSVVLAGTMITETIFDIPGIGLLLFEGIQNRDYPVVQGVISYSTVIYLGVYFLVDALNAKIDPRIES